MRRRTIFLAVTLLVTAPAALVVAQTASDFDDVPPGAFFADAADALVGSGITTGCDDNSYCPGQAVTRAQMAAFLHRGLPRTAFHRGVGTLEELPDSDEFGAVVAEVELDTGGAPGGTGFVTFQGSVNVYGEGDASACPCEIEARIFRRDLERAGPSSWAQLPAQATSDGAGNINVALPVTWATNVDTAVKRQFQLHVYAGAQAPQGLRAEGSLSAIYVPFGADGDAAALGANHAAPRPAPRTSRTTPVP